MRTITIESNRFYHLSDETKEAIDKTIASFNRAVYSSYNLHFLKDTDSESFKSKYKDKSLHMIIKQKYEFDDYYSNSVTQLAKGKLNSQKELQKEYIKTKEAALKSVKTKRRDYEKLLSDYIRLLESLHRYRTKIKIEPNAKLIVKGIRNLSVSSYDITVRYFKSRQLVSETYGLYSFEYQYLIPKIHHIKTVLSNLKYKENRLHEQLQNLRTMKRIIFGSKKLMRTHTAGDKRLGERKYNSFQISGRKDAKYGNFVFKLHELESGTKESPVFQLTVRMCDKKEITLNHIKFPYKGMELVEVLKKKTPICFALKRKTDKQQKEYYQIFVSFDISVTKDINHDTSTGIFGMDFNYSHLDISEIDEKGNLVSVVTIPYQITGDSKVNERELRAALNIVGMMVQKSHKCLVIERLDTRDSKRRSTYRDPITNKIFHTFAYERYSDFVDWLGYQYGFEIIKVNPAFTSIIGSLKYAIPRKLNSHQAASYVIARRGMVFKENITKQYRPLVDNPNKHHWSQWNQIHKKLQVVNK